MDWGAAFGKVLDGYVEVEKEKAKATATNNPQTITQPQKGADHTGRAIADTSNLPMPAWQKYTLWGVAGVGLLGLGVLAIRGLK